MAKLKLDFKTVAIGAGIAYVGYKLYKKEPLFGKKEVAVVATTTPLEVSNAAGLTAGVRKGGRVPCSHPSGNFLASTAEWCTQKGGKVLRA